MYGNCKQKKFKLNHINIGTDAYKPLLVSGTWDSSSTAIRHCPVKAPVPTIPPNSSPLLSFIPQLTSFQNQILQINVKMTRIRLKILWGERNFQARSFKLQLCKEWWTPGWGINFDWVRWYNTEQIFFFLQQHAKKLWPFYFSIKHS